MDWPFTLVRVFAFYPFYACGVLLRPQLDRLAAFAAEHRPVRLMGGALSLLTGAGLIAKAMPLAQEGRAAAARVCLAAGSLVLLAEAARILFLRRK